MNSEGGEEKTGLWLVSGDQLDMIPTVSYAAGIPTCLLATYLVESRGLKTGLRIGSYLTGRRTSRGILDNP
jgi:hypothetical protein